jgi:hypothetical protein
MFVLALVVEGFRRALTFGELGGFVLVDVRRRFFMASLTAAGVPQMATQPWHRREVGRIRVVSFNHLIGARQQRF